MTDLLIVVGIVAWFFTPEEERKEASKDWSSMKVTELKDELRQRGLAVGGLKAELVERLTEASRNGSATVARHAKLDEFHSFRRTYYLVYAIIMLADWMQGTHMYTLYMSYGMNVSHLFLTGFLSGGIFAPFLGSFVDKFGRKRSCIIYCLLEITINVMEAYPNIFILMLGRIMGGVSTNLLFSAFESWMTTEHRGRGFPEEWLSTTYSTCSVINGSMAVLAGIVAQVLEDFFGQIGPFHGAVGLTVTALLLVLGWEENYGEEQKGDHEKSSIMSQFKEGWRAVLSDWNILRIGLVQALSEGAMYTFVFMWVPTLLSLDPPGGLPTGCVFSSLMIAITIGGLCSAPFHWIIGRFISHDYADEYGASIVYSLASICMAIPVLCLSTFSGNEGCQTYVITSFMIVEFCVGMFMPSAGTLRSKYVPDNLQGAILNIFRLPLNTTVVLGTYATDMFEASLVFKLVSATFMAASLLQATMIGAKPKEKYD